MTLTIMSAPWTSPGPPELSCGLSLRCPWLQPPRSLGFWVKANGRSSLPIQESQKQRGCPPGRCISSYCCCTATPSQSIVASSDAICASLATASWDGADVLVLRLPGGQCKCLPVETPWHKQTKQHFQIITWFIVVSQRFCTELLCATLTR